LLSEVLSTRTNFFTDNAGGLQALVELIKLHRMCWLWRVSDKSNFAMPLVIREGASEMLEASMHLLDLCRPHAFEDL